MTISVTELPTAGGPGGRVATAYMTMNLAWCSDGENVTYAAIQSSNADRTTAGATGLLERRSYTSGSTPPTYVGGPYTTVTAATWGRNLEEDFGPIKFADANFTSTMTVNVYPTDARVECTGTSGGHPEPCEVNLAMAPKATETAELCTPNSGVVSYFAHSPDGGTTINYWKVFYDGRVGDKQAYRFILYNAATGKYDIDRGTNSTMCPTTPPPPGQPALTPPPPPLPPGQPVTGVASVCWNSTIRSVWEVPGYIQYTQLTFDSSYGEVWYGTVVQHFRYKRSIWNGTAWIDSVRRPQDFICNNYHQGPGNWTWTSPPNIEPVPLP